VEEINMRTRPFPQTEDPVSPSPSDRARTRGRTTGVIPKFFTITQVAELLGVCTRTVRRWIDTGRLVAHRFGGAVRIADQDLRAFLSQHRAA
jgi:excisionase family DNA binding protein